MQGDTWQFPALETEPPEFIQTRSSTTANNRERMAKGPSVRGKGVRLGKSCTHQENSGNESIPCPLADGTLPTLFAVVLVLHPDRN